MFSILPNFFGGESRRRARREYRATSIETPEHRQLLAADLTIPSANAAILEISPHDATLLNISASFLASNIGDQSAVGDVTFQAFLSADQIFGNGDDFAAGGNSAGLDLEPAASINRVISGTPAATEYLASNFLLIKVDFSDSIAEGNESNNVVAIPLPRLPFLATSNGQTTGQTKKTVVVDSQITFTDADSNNFNGGALRVSVLDDQADNNILSLAKTKTSSGILRISKGQLRIGKTVIGTVTGGINAEPLIITFTTQTSKSTIQTIAAAITLRGKKGVAGVRTVNFQVFEPTIIAGPVATKLVNLS